jgi:bacterioferritin B
VIINEKTVDAMNAQIQSEFLASAQYAAMAIYFDEKGLPDLAQYFYRQSDEERGHAMKFVHFMLDAGAKPLIPAVPEVRNEFESPEDVVETSLKQELKVTDQINNLMHIAVEERDFTSQQFLQWFVDEQVEEVESFTLLLQTIQHSAGNLLLVEDFVRRHAQPQGPSAA